MPGGHLRADPGRINSHGRNQHPFLYRQFGEHNKYKRHQSVPERRGYFPQPGLWGTPSARTVSYTGLPVNPTLVNNAGLNGATVGIHVTDASGIVATNLYTYDT